MKKSAAVSTMRRCSGSFAAWRPLQAAGDRPKLCFLHYPPRYRGYECPEILKLLRRYGVRACYYSHLHGASHKLAIEACGMVDFRLLAADYLNFRPAKIISEEMQEKWWTIRPFVRIGRIPPWRLHNL